jgi:tRNA pseudouridine32 synthase/23S rRNA pseudouridine746 synthase
VVTHLDVHDSEAAGEVPAKMPSPFGEPCALARRAAERMVAELPDALRREGKMFGVLVVRDGDGIGFLRAFSGMVDGRWLVDGFVPPTFDLAARDAFWLDGEAELIAIADRMAVVDRALAPLREALDRLRAQHAVELAALRDKHVAAKAKRDDIRRTDPTRAAALAKESANETNEKRRVVQRQREEQAAMTDRMTPLEAQRKALDDERAHKSRGFLVRIHNTYSLPNGAGEERPLRELFAPAEPPGGAGDCAAPKLLAYAYRHGLEPIAIAEVWVGPPPPTGDRRDGHYYPACRGKCGPILAHMLEGLDSDEAPQFGGGPIDAAEPRTLFEDEWLVVVDKPVGLLSVPGRGGALRDSVLSRLRDRYPDATGPIIVHRLDLDTSGVLLAAKDAATHKELQRLFAVREVEKRYIAILDGELAEESGTIDLPLRVDLDDRPRQIVDPVHGKSAVTEWRVIGRPQGRTRVAMWPKTGRAHQLRVHSLVGLGVPIVGDRLYGRPDSRLLLHAEELAFVHPHRAERLVITRPAPF